MNASSICVRLRRAYGQQFAFGDKVAYDISEHPLIEEACKIIEAQRKELNEISCILHQALDHFEI